MRPISILVGELGATVADGALGSTASSRPGGGTMELLGHQYVVERAMLAFAGAVDDPELHMRLTRRVGTATIAVVIEGTAEVRGAPQLRAAGIRRVAAGRALLAGRPTPTASGSTTCNGRITGLLSALVIRKIQDELAPTLPVDVLAPARRAELRRALGSRRWKWDASCPIASTCAMGSATGSWLGRSAVNAEEASADIGSAKVSS